MRYAGIDLHRRTLVVFIEDETGQAVDSRQFSCRDVEAIRTFFSSHRPFKAVIESSCSYRWLHDLLSVLGEVVLAHPLRLRAIAAGRAKTDKLDARLLAKLLRGGLIPPAYVPPPRYQNLRDLTRARARLSREAARAKNELHALWARANLYPPYQNPFGVRGKRWMAETPLPGVFSTLREELLRRLTHFQAEIHSMDQALQSMANDFPETEAITGLHGVGLYTALLVIGELGDPRRFSNERQVGAYAGLTARVSQSGGHARYGAISRQGSPWLRWILVEAAIKIVRRDAALHNFYDRIRKRAGAKVARVAVARKLSGICWQRLLAWHRARPAA